VPDKNSHTRKIKKSKCLWAGTSHREVWLAGMEDARTLEPVWSHWCYRLL